MAFLQTIGPAGLRMASFDFSFVDRMTLLERSSTTLSRYATPRRRADDWRARDCVRSEWKYVGGYHARNG